MSQLCAGCCFSSGGGSFHAAAAEGRLWRGAGHPHAADGRGQLRRHSCHHRFHHVLGCGLRYRYPVSAFGCFLIPEHYQLFSTGRDHSGRDNVAPVCRFCARWIMRFLRWWFKAPPGTTCWEVPWRWLVDCSLEFFSASLSSIFPVLTR